MSPLTSIGTVTHEPLEHLNTGTEVCWPFEETRTASAAAMPWPVELVVNRDGETFCTGTVLEATFAEPLNTLTVATPGAVPAGT